MQFPCGDRKERENVYSNENLTFTLQLSRRPSQDYFYSLKNVTFCGFHPSSSEYFGFVTKHPRLPRYACHVFLGEGSTQHVAEACG